MPRKIPDDAFDWFIGNDATYQEVANNYGVSKRAVVAHARKHRWTDRLNRLRAEARERSDQKIVESLESMNDRHLKSLRVVQGKALEALKTMPLSSAMEAVRALDLAIKQERVIRGEPGDRTAVSVEEAIRTEYQRWLVSGEADDDAQD